MSVRRHQISRRPADAHQAVVVVVDDPQDSGNVLGVESTNRPNYVSLALTVHELTVVVPSSAPESYITHTFNYEKRTVVNHSHHLDLGCNRAGIFVPTEHSDRVSQTDHQIRPFTDDEW